MSKAKPTMGAGITMRHIIWTNQEKGDFDVHFEDKLNGEFTLCGLAYEGVDIERFDISQDFKETKKKITCERCIAIIKMCKAVKSTEMIYLN